MINESNYCLWNEYCSSEWCKWTKQVNDGDWKLIDSVPFLTSVLIKLKDKLIKFQYNLKSISKNGSVQMSNDRMYSWLSNLDPDSYLTCMRHLAVLQARRVALFFFYCGTTCDFTSPDVKWKVKSMNETNQHL